MNGHNPERELAGFVGRLVELAQRKAADDPALACAAWRAVQLEDAPTPPGGGWAFIASYGGRSVVVAVEADAVEADAVEADAVEADAVEADGEE